jgi:hypothetical protein
VASIQSTKIRELRKFPNLDTFIQLLRDEFDAQADPKVLSPQNVQTMADPENEHFPDTWQMDQGAEK